jgi:hypothetical protein
VVEQNRECLTAGMSARVRYPAAVESADRAFALLSRGVAVRYDGG